MIAEINLISNNKFNHKATKAKSPEGRKDDVGETDGGNVMKS